MEKADIVLQQTADGTHTLYLPEMDEHYHSTNGALQEAKHVYINAAFRECDKREVNLFEVGFGTGLNTFLTMLEAEKSNRLVHYTSIERYPLSSELIAKLNYALLIAPEKQLLFDKMHYCAWNEEVWITPLFCLKKVNNSLLEYVFDKDFDVVYYDAFAPDKQPEMWQPFLFEKIFSRMNEGGVLTTYCAKGIVRRTLQSAGFIVERLSGPVGKREMLRATAVMKKSDE